MKNYIAEIATDQLSDNRINPSWTQQLRNVGDIQKIVVHHSASFAANEYDDDELYATEAAYQNNISIPGSRGLQYHYSIDNVGLINQARPHNVILWHCGNLDVNNHSIAIKLDGNFETQQPTREQLEALKQLLDWLCTQHPEFPAVASDVYPHRAFFNTACPGANLVGFINDYRANGTYVIPDAIVYQHPELQPQAAQTAPTQPTPGPEAPKAPSIPAPAKKEPAPVVTDSPEPALPNPTTTNTPSPDIIKPGDTMFQTILANFASRKFLLAVAAALTFYLNGDINQALIVILGYFGVNVAATVANK